MLGYARVTEVVHHPESGWNVHFHVPLLLDDELDDQQLYELQDRVTARFTRGIGDAGGQASCGGQHLGPIQPGSERRLARYYAKGTTVYRSETGRGGGRRPGSDGGADLVGSRTPMAILADLKETGEGLGLWKEFSAAVTGIKRRRYSPSQGIASTQRRVEHANGIAQCADDHFVGGPLHYYLIYMGINSTRPCDIRDGSVSPEVIRPEEAVVECQSVSTGGRSVSGRPPSRDGRNVHQKSHSIPAPSQCI